MRSKIILCALIAIAMTALLYSINFFFILKFGIAKTTEEWGQFGDYFGGVLNPILSFIAMILLIKSLTLQNEANLNLRKELKNNEKIEKSRTFSILFFNIIDSQKSLLKEFEVQFPDGLQPKTGISAIILIEQNIESLRKTGATDKKIKEFINNIDRLDCIFGFIRSFYVAIKLISERLNNENGFSQSDRESHYLALINLTEFSQIRMILMGVQFIDCHYSKYIRNNLEFQSVMKSVNLDFDLY